MLFISAPSQLILKTAQNAQHCTLDTNRKIHTRSPLFSLWGVAKRVPVGQREWGETSVLFCLLLLLSPAQDFRWTYGLGKGRELWAGEPFLPSRTTVALPAGRREPPLLLLCCLVPEADAVTGSIQQRKQIQYYVSPQNTTKGRSQEQERVREILERKGQRKWSGELVYKLLGSSPSWGKKTRHSPCWSCAVLMNQGSSILTDEDNAGWSIQTAKLWSPQLHVDGPNQGAGAGTSVSISPLPSGPERVLSLSTEDWVSPADLTHGRCVTGAERMGAELSRPVQSRAELSSLRAAWSQGRCTPGLQHSRGISQLSCFALNIVSFFTTTPQTGDSCWHWTDIVTIGWHNAIRVRQRTQFLKWTKSLNRHFSNKNIQIKRSIWKDFQYYDPLKNFKLNPKEIPLHTYLNG